MSDQDKEAAKQHAGRAARQMRHAARNAGEAAEAAADIVKDEASEATERTKEGVKELAQKLIYSEMGRGVLALSFALISAGVGINKIQTARRMNANLRDMVAKGDA